MSEIIISIALQAESNGHVEKLIETYENKNSIHLVYTGVGKVNASYFLTKKIQEIRNGGKDITIVINIGTAGGKNLKRGEIVYCSQFVQRDFDLSPLGFDKGVNIFVQDAQNKPELSQLILKHNHQISLNLKNVICGTGDNFETKINCHSCQIKELQTSVQEMEAYALAAVCKYENIDFAAVKYVSDEINFDKVVGVEKTQQAEDFNNALNNAAKSLTEALKTILDTI